MTTQSEPKPKSVIDYRFDSERSEQLFPGCCYEITIDGKPVAYVNNEDIASPLKRMLKAEQDGYDAKYVHEKMDELSLWFEWQWNILTRMRFAVQRRFENFNSMDVLKENMRESIDKSQVNVSAYEKDVYINPDVIFEQ